MTTDATFDASTSTGTAAPAAPPADPAAEREQAVHGLSALDQLAAQIEERDQEEETTVAVEIPGLDVRLVCSTVAPYEEYKRWQMASFPPKERRSRRPRPMAMSQLYLSCTVLASTCEAIEYKAGEQWKPLLDSSGQPYTLESDELLHRYGVLDSHQLVQKLFGRDARVLAAGEKVMVASSWVEDDESDDPMG